MEETVTNEEKNEKVDGRRRKSLATTEGGNVEETVMNEEKEEKIDGRRRKVLVTTENTEGNRLLMKRKLRRLMKKGRSPVKIWRKRRLMGERRVKRRRKVGK
ncbi:hypothetical protein LSTR_LSTR016501 [Laodelphax striatellus]|uniref:Uncharacterized protein n=1 Tax=Laodelphax striatellus TaxID=195883 RepID=A0A482XC37_LAOST|nr:hypothetical protein LSTR_LSTR016501 [Laodelphax striatellus]